MTFNWLLNQNVRILNTSDGIHIVLTGSRSVIGLSLFRPDRIAEITLYIHSDSFVPYHCPICLQLAYGVLFSVSNFHWLNTHRLEGCLV